MNKFSKVIAFALATTMVLGSTVTAFAGDNDGASTGTGTSEGHVEKKVSNVVLPTISQGSTPFAYTMDPEGLVVATAGAKYTDAVFPDSASDKHVYFNNGTNDQSKTVYANSSAVQKVTNKSSHKVNLTVTATATTAATDIPLVAESALSTADSASLYLGLLVGTKSDTNTAQAITETAATKTVELDGVEGNFMIAVDNGAYVYRVKSPTEWAGADNIGDGKTYADATAAETAFNATWANTTFNLEGAVTSGKAITATTTAPSIAVTWSWTDPTAAPTSYTVTYKSNYTDGPEDATEDVAANGNPTGPETAFTRTGYTLAGWATAADGEAAALSTFTITEATTLYAIWAEQKTGYAFWDNSASAFYFGVDANTGFDLDGADISSFKINNKTVEYTTADYNGKWIAVAPSAIEAVSEDNGWASGTTLAFKVTFGNYEYSATYTQP